MSLKDLIKSSAEQPRVVPETFFGHPCFIKQWDSRAHDAWDFAQAELNKVGLALKDFRARVVVASLVDAEVDGKPVFGPEDVDAVAGMASPEVNRVYDRCAELHGLKESTDAKKNS